MGPPSFWLNKMLKKALQIADYAYVMETGKIVLHGDAADVAANPQVTEAYLGGKK